MWSGFLRTGMQNHFLKRPRISSLRVRITSFATVTSFAMVTSFAGMTLFATAWSSECSGQILCAGSIVCNDEISCDWEISCVCQIVCNGQQINCNGDIECGGSIECRVDIDCDGYGFCDGYIDRDVDVVWNEYNDHDGGHRYSSPQTATDFVWPIRDWKNLCVIAMVAQDDLIDLWVCEFTMDDYVEWLLQDRDTEPSLQTDRRARSTDLQQPSRDWQNMYVMAPQNNFIDLSGDFNIDNFVEWLLRTGMQNHLKPLNRSPRKQSAGFWAHFF